MNIHNADLLPVPKALADLQTWPVSPWGDVVTGTDVAKAFRVTPATLRTWRKRGRWPEAVNAADKSQNVAYYRVADLVGEYYRRFPGELPDRPEDSLGRFYAVAMDAMQGTEDVEVGVSEAVSARVNGRVTPFSLKDAFEMELKRVFGEAVAELVEREPEPPAVIESLSAELAAQRSQIDEQRREIEQLRVELTEARARETEALQWRDKPLLDRLRKT